MLPAHDLIKQIRQEVKQVMIGKEKETDLLLTALFSEGHVLLEDVPGTGKTLLAKTLALVLGCDFKRIQLTPDLLPSDILGIQVFSQKTGAFEFRSGPVFTHILLADELNRATPRTQSSLLESMEEGQVTIDGYTRYLPQPFFVIATQNPLESQGTFPLPEAQLDRFLLKLATDYPDLEQERTLLRRFKKDRPQDHVKAVLSPEQILDIRKSAREVHIHGDVETYLLHIVHKTRNHPQIEVGVSPRGSLVAMKACQSYAFLQGRDYVTPDDVQTLVPYVFSHRIILTLDAQLKYKVEEILQEIIKQTEVPLERLA